MATLSFNAHAEDAATPDKKITGGTGTCTVDVLGVSDNNATANTIATWSLNSYECAAGQYLDETTLLCTECPVGSYCPGGTFTVEANNSKTACPIDYTSDVAATAESECYMGCELTCSANAECPPHSNNCTHSEFKTTGKQYVDATCNAYPSVCPVADFGCDIGYSKTTMKNADFLVAMLGEDGNNLSLLVELGCSPTGITTVRFGYLGDSMTTSIINACDFIANGEILSLVGTSGFVTASVLNNYDENTPGIATVEYPDPETNLTISQEYLSNANFLPTAGTGNNLWRKSLAKLALPTPDTLVFVEIFANIEYVYDMLTSDNADAFISEMEIMIRSNTSEEVANKLIELANQTKSGIITSLEEFLGGVYLISLPTMQFIETDMPWVFVGSKQETTTWEDVALGFIGFVLDGHAFPDGEFTYCANNIINIDWNPDNGDASTQNMCMYDGPVTLPSDPVRPGYTFMGWKLVE